MVDFSDNKRDSCVGACKAKDYLEDQFLKSTLRIAQLPESLYDQKDSKLWCMHIARCKILEDYEDP